VYHLELRKFPHVVCRFNQSEAELRAIVVPWARQEWVEQGERKWNVNEATLTVLEGPELSMPELAMGRGWRNAQKRSQDVTERVLAAARAGSGGRAGGGGQEPAVGVGGAVAADGPVAGEGAQGDRADDFDLLADSLGLEVLAQLDRGPLAPLQVWRMAEERLDVARPDPASAAEALALAERALGSLLRRDLVVLREEGEGIAPARQEAILAAVETWSGGAGGPVLIAREP